MKKYSTLLIIFIIFLEPSLEAASQAILPENLYGLSFFFLLMIIILLSMSGRKGIVAVLLAAVWRDIILLESAATIFGAGIGLLVIFFLRQALTNRSAVTDSIIVLLAYVGYVLGLAAVLWTSKNLFFADAARQGPSILLLVVNFSLAFIVFIFWRRQQSSQVSYNFHQPL